MDTKQTDVMIHTREVLNPKQFEEVSRQVNSLEGIVSFKRNEKWPNLIMVDYNPSQTRSLAILNEVTGFGLQASLVGI